MDIWIWVAIIVIALIVEFVSTQLISVWFSVAGIIPLILAICKVDIWIQVVVFCVLSVVLIIGLRKICKKLFKNGNEKTNMESFIGKKILLLTDVDENTSGKAKINDVIWNVIEETGKEIKKGEHAEIISISGNKIIVRKGEDK